MYHIQLSVTREKARKVQAEIDKLKRDHSSHADKLKTEDESTPSVLGSASSSSTNPLPEGRGAEMQKLEFLVAQMGVYSNIIKILIAQVAKLEMEDVVCGGLPESRLESQKEFYSEAWTLLKTIEISFDSALSIPAKSFESVCKKFKSNLRNLCEQHPHQVSNLVASGFVMGGFAGVMLGSVTERAEIIAASALCGALVGVALAAICAALTTITDYAMGNEDEEPEKETDHQKLQKMIDSLQKIDLPAESLTNIRELFDKCFMKAAVQPEIKDECIICHEFFPEYYINGDETPVRAPLCEERHFLHKKCYISWTKTSCDLRCTICRK